MAPIRVGLIGLSAKSRSGWAAAAHLPYLLSPRGKERYQIVAVLGSTTERARESVEHFSLPNPDSIRTYGAPEELAADPNVDLVVCSVRVDKHYDTVRPSVAAGKDVIVEWPLAEDTLRAKELADLSKKAGGRTAVVAQARLAPYFVKLKELLADGTIGKVINSQVNSNATEEGQDSVFRGMESFGDPKSGASFYAIFFGHTWDPIQYVLGDAKDPGFVWTIRGEKGSLRLTYEGRYVNQGDGALIEWHDRATGETRPVEWQWQEWQAGHPGPVRNVAALYEVFADGDESKYVTFDVALKRHEQLDSIRENSSK
ncbi:oxidoreductase family protein [Diaporthe helianthi]|uniref:Oxidoreductase family protein n=1 Tax=Diaporthe helianthi TaxID=158607 RepID=A0A2P5HY05_DIAHE|nr:oxidoreductase family protein [Diaporthe helianthi]